MIALRHFTPDDASALKRALWPDMPLDEIVRMIGEWNTLTFNGRYFEMFAVVRDDGIVGTASLYEHTVSTASLGVEIFESARRNGYADEAMSALSAFARDKGYRILCDQVGADNAASIRLHDKQGFETDGYVYRNKKEREIVLYWKAL